MKTFVSWAVLLALPLAFGLDQSPASAWEEQTFQLHLDPETLNLDPEKVDELSKAVKELRNLMADTEAELARIREANRAENARIMGWVKRLPDYFPYESPQGGYHDP